jgi:hypothetical protein
LAASAAAACSATGQGAYAPASGNGCTSVSISTSGSTRYLVIITAGITPTTSGNGSNTGWESYAVSGALAQSATDANAVSFGGATGASGTSQASSESVVIAPNTGSITFTMQQKTSSNNNVSFTNRSITVVPLN